MNAPIVIHPNLYESKGSFPVFWVILITILVIFIIFLILLLARLNSVKVDPNQCPVVKGTYGVVPRSNGEVINQCGFYGNNPCISTQRTLEDAINECNSQKNICSMFSYNASTSELKFIDTVEPGGGSTDVYIRQLTPSST